MTTIHVGDILRCASCGHTREVSPSWLNAVGSRVGRQIGPEDLERFKCSRCNKKELRIFQGAPARIADSGQREATGRQLAVAVVSEASLDERLLLAQWAKQMLTIRDSNASSMEKAREAVRETVRSRAIWPFIKTIAREIKRVGWDQRGVPARIGISAAAIALALPGHGAGIAALGGAFGVPLWVVFGAGGTFIGVLLEELARKGINTEGSVIAGQVVKRR